MAALAAVQAETIVAATLFFLVGQGGTRAVSTINLYGLGCWVHEGLSRSGSREWGRTSIGTVGRSTLLKETVKDALVDSDGQSNKVGQGTRAVGLGECCVYHNMCITCVCCNLYILSTKILSTKK